MKYLIMIHSNPASRQVWEGFTDEQRAEGFKYYAGLREDLEATGELIVTQALADPSTATRVTVTGGETVTSDGPFAEVKEHLAGFFLVDCDSRERAVEIAARCPEAMFGLIEVRPVLTSGGGVDM